MQSAEGVIIKLTSVLLLFPVKVARIMLIDAVKGKSLTLSHSPVIDDKI